jgi:hypothetical protein
MYQGQLATLFVIVTNISKLNQQDIYLHPD